MPIFKIYTKVTFPLKKNPRGIGLFSSIFFENGQEAHEISKCYKGTSLTRLEILALIETITMIENEYIQGKFIFYTKNDIVSKTVNIWMRMWAKKGWDICGKKNTDLWRILYKKWDRKKFEMRFSGENKYFQLVEGLNEAIIAELKIGKEILHQEIHKN